MHQSLQDIVWSIVATIALLLVPTVAHWLWTGRKGSPASSYQRVFTHLMMWFGALIVLWGAMFLGMAVLDLLKQGGWGLASPLGVVFSLVFVGVGLLLFLGCRAMLRRGPDLYL